MWEKKVSPRAFLAPKKAFKRFKLFLLSRPPSHAAVSILLYFDR
jgi:hypothetical protein